MDKLRFVGGLIVLLVILSVGLFLNPVGSSHESDERPASASPPNARRPAGSLASLPTKSLPDGNDGDDLKNEEISERIEQAVAEFEDFLKADEYSRILKSVSHEDPDAYKEYSYEVWIRTPSEREVENWRMKRKSIMESMDLISSPEANVKLREIEGQFTFTDAPERRVTFDVPHDGGEMRYSECGVLDLTIPENSKYLSAIGIELPRGEVHYLPHFTDRRVKQNRGWRYDHLIEDAD